MRGWALLKFQCYDALDKAALWTCAERVVAVSQSMAATLKASNYRASAVMHIHNGIDLRAVKASRAPDDVRRELGIGLEQLVIGTAGRLSPVKGHEHLVRAAQLIARREDRARFLFVGNGPLKGALRTLAADLGLDDRCTFVDLQDHPRLSVYDVMRVMDVFVLPSLHEGIPMALLEAMALETPVVASAVGGIPEVITHRHDGLLVRSRNHGDLAEACLELIGNPELSRTFGGRARRVVHDRFSRDANGETVLDLYRHIAGEDAAAGTRKAVRSAGLGALTGRVVRRVFGAIEQTVERHRMNRIRRHPEPLMARLRSAKSVLIVCHGNIIRSAFAARQLVQALGHDRSVSISSAGLEAVSGRPSHPTAVLTAAPLRVDLTRHTAAPLRPAAVASSDVIFVMDVQQLVTLCRRFPHARAKTFLLTCLASDRPLEVRDPVDGDETVFQACFEHISGATRPIIQLLSAAVE
jgi:protein-tyrosine-phosphatase